MWKRFWKPADPVPIMTSDGPALPMIFVYLISKKNIKR